MKKITFSVPILIVFALLIFMAQAAFSAEPEIVLRFAGQSAEEHITTGFMREVADEVARRSGGRIEIKVYPDNKLAEYSLVHQELIKGSIDMALISTPGDIDPRLSFVYINGYCSGYDDIEKTFKPDSWAFNKMAGLNEELGVKFLGFSIVGFIGIASSKPIDAPLDPNAPKDTLLRIPDMPPFITGSPAMGYKRPVWVPYSGLYTAMADGEVEAVNGLPSSDAYIALREATKYWYQLNHAVEAESYLISKKTWEKLSPKDRGIITDVVDAISAKSFYAAKWADERYMDMMRERGVEVYTYSEEELKPLRAAASAAWPKLRDTMTAPFMDEFEREFAVK